MAMVPYNYKLLKGPIVVNTKISSGSGESKSTSGFSWWFGLLPQTLSLRDWEFKPPGPTLSVYHSLEKMLVYGPYGRLSSLKMSI